MNTLIDSSSLQETEDILILILSLFLFILQSNFVVCYSISIFNAFSLQGAKKQQKKSICSVLQQYSFLLQHTKSRSLIPVYVQIALTSGRRPRPQQTDSCSHTWYNNLQDEFYTGNQDVESDWNQKVLEKWLLPNVIYYPQRGENDHTVYMGGSKLNVPVIWQHSAEGAGESLLMYYWCTLLSSIPLHACSYQAYERGCLS